MAVYKVIQDIEAEDKILGPLTLKSFVYALIAGGLAFVCVRLAISGFGEAKWAVILLLLPPILVFGILAAPIGKDQPTEVWILSHLRFFVQNRKRIWDQTGVSELVTITAPKKIEKQLTKTFTREEVDSRLKALAATLDSRGWAVKNVTTDIYGQPDYFLSGNGDSDRLVGASSVNQSTAVLDVHESDDILDEQSNKTAQNFNQLMQKADNQRKEAMQNLINNPPQAQTVDYRFLDEQSAETPGMGGASFVGTNLTAPNSEKLAVNTPRQATALEEELGDSSLREKHPHFETKPSLADERRLVEAQKAVSTAQATPAQNVSMPTQSVPVVAQSTPPSVSQLVKADLAKSDDLSVAAVAQLANHHETVRQIGPNEVEITLH